MLFGNKVCEKGTGLYKYMKPFEGHTINIWNLTEGHTIICEQMERCAVFCDGKTTQKCQLTQYINNTISVRILRIFFVGE